MRWILWVVHAAMIATACSEAGHDDIGKYDYLNDLTSYATDEDYATVPDEDSDGEKTWQVRFQFYGVINAENTPSGSLRLGDGRLFYTDESGEEQAFVGALWVMKKNINNSAGFQIPLLQVFFAQHLQDGEGALFVLQLDGSSLNKEEVFYLNNDQLYLTDATRQDGELTKICFRRSAYDGIVHLFSHSIREGEPLSLDGYADLRDMDPVECKTLQ